MKKQLVLDLSMMMVNLANMAKTNGKLQKKKKKRAGNSMSLLSHIHVTYKQGTFNCRTNVGS